MPQASSEKIICNVVLGPNATQFYGTLNIDNIRYESGGLVTIQDFLGVKFKSPTDVAAADLFVNLDPWQEASSQVSNERIDSGTVNVTVKIQVQESHTFKPHDTLTWGINGDLTVSSESYISSFELYVDKLPSGAVDA
jgi:hypothetical protein